MRLSFSPLNPHVKPYKFIMITLKNVDFSYPKGAQIVHNVSLNVARGQVVAVMGPSGCGKTTLLRLIAGLLQPSVGQALLLGQEMPYDDAPALRVLRGQMGMLFQFGALFTDMSVFDNVAFPLRENTALSMSEVSARVMKKLDAVGLADVADKMPAEVSGGMARRVALARAIAQDPKIMLFDEPFTGLDPIAMDNIAQLIREQTNALNAASVVVSHDVHETFAIADYVYIMHKSHILAHGTPEQLLLSEDAFVRRFVHGRDVKKELV